MDSNNFDDEIEKLDEEPNTTQEITDTEMPEDYLDESYEETYDNSHNRPKFGEREYKNAKDENGHHDKDYYKKRGQELDEKVDEARTEKGKNWKKKDPNDEGLVKADGSNTENKNRRDRLKDNINLERAKYDRWKNKLDGIKAKTYQTMHPVEAAKEEAKEKAKDAAKATGKAAAKAAKATGRLVAAGGKAVIAFLASNPIVLGALVVIIILFMVLFMLFSGTSNDDSDSLGYFDTTCDFNLTTVEYSCPPYEEEAKDMSLKDYVLGVAYGESKEENFSEAAMKALMIIVKTNALAEGNYDSSGSKIVRLNTCNVIYEDAYEELDDEEENKERKDKVKILEQYYNEIINFLFISESYTSEITDLGEADVLEYNDDIIEMLAKTNKNSYEEILKEIYPVNEDEEEKEETTTQDDKPYLFIGDSRTAQMNDAVNELTNDNTVAEYSKRYDWFESYAVSTVNSILDKSDKEYNIVSWMGVNDAADTTTAEKYFKKYKELAEGQWSKHTIYVVSVGPVGPNYSYGTLDSKTFNEDIDYFNDTMEKAINEANISNLKFIRLNYNINAYLENDKSQAHYSNEDSKKIFNDIINKIYKNKTLSKVKALFDNKEYCTYYHYNNGCEMGWWYPIGESGNFKKGAILRGEPELVDTGEDNFGYRKDPFTGELAYHDASDLWAPTIGMNVIATRSGTITTAVDGNADSSGANNGGGCGNYIIIDHGDGFSSIYCHLKKGSVTKYSSVGMQVSQGQIIALSGNSGRTTGPHLHFGIRKDGSVVNPFDYISTENTRPTSKCSNYSQDKEGVCLAYKKLGYSDNLTAALMANIFNEFGFNPDQFGDDAGGLSYGMMAWHDVSQCAAATNPCDAATKLSGYTCNGKRLKCFCQQNNMEWNTVECQTAYLKDYIEWGATQGSAFDFRPYLDRDDLSAADLAYHYCDKLENPFGGYAECMSRRADADNMLQFVKNGCKEEED